MAKAKMKTNRAAAKRFKRTASGRIKRHCAYHGHNFTCKSPKRKRNLRQSTIMHQSDVARVRRVAVVRPYGLDTPLEVSELLPPEAEYPKLTDEHIGFYESGLDAFLAGAWREAYELLRHVPTDDLVSDFLTVFIAQHKRTPPPDWDGVIPLSSK